jgi:hypothetical protein
VRRIHLGQRSARLRPEDHARRAKGLRPSISIPRAAPTPRDRSQGRAFDTSAGARASGPSSTVATDRRILERHVKPLLGRRKVKSVTRADIERTRRDVAEGKTAKDEKLGFRRSIVRGGKAVANRMVDTLASMFEFARSDGLRDDNPARGIEDYKLAKRERFLTTAEMATLGDELVAAAQRDDNPSAIAALRLLLLRPTPLLARSSSCRLGVSARSTMTPSSSSRRLMRPNWH